jgi:hypothetical protein
MFNKAVPTPANTTKWFLPTLGQWIDMIEKLSDQTMQESQFVTWWWSNYSFGYYFTGNEYNNIVSKFENSGCTYDKFVNNYWSSTEFDDIQAGMIYFESSGFYIYERGKGDASMYVRCFLGF